MNGYTANIAKITAENENFRQVLYTTKNCQLVVMSLLPGEEIGMEVHDVDQFLRIEKGTGTTVLNDKSHELNDGIAIIVPAGTKHNVKNTGTDKMKLYTLYTPPHHLDGTVHKTKAESETDLKDEFDGKTTE